MTAVLLGLLIAPQAPTELSAYLGHAGKPSWTVDAASNGDQEIHLTSQTWQGAPWRHTVLFRPAKAPVKKGLGVLFITGNGPRPGDRLILDAMAAQTGLPVAVLFNVPNQPLYGGLSEDDLIAYTFAEYIKTGDARWPLLFPMVKSAVSAMDAVQAASQATGNPIKEFVVSGASKRGWTTWLTGASGDKRVKAIAPMVIDTLNMPKQMAHQLEMFGGEYSEQIEAYTKLGIQAQMKDGPGARLARMVDPYSYRSIVTVPTLLVHGANDPYWTTDATSLYFDDLNQPKWLVTVPNAGHDLGDKTEALETFGAFCKSVAGAVSFPHEVWTQEAMAGGKARVSVKVAGQALQKLTVWMAVSDKLDFRKERFLKVGEAGPDRAHAARLDFDLPKGQSAAVFGEATYLAGGKATFRLCCPTKVYRKQPG